MSGSSYDVGMSNKRAVWWVKRDARLRDNEALTVACQKIATVLPLYVFEPLLLKGPDWGPAQSYAVVEAVTKLRKNLQHHGNDLWVRSGTILAELEALHREYPFTDLFAHLEVGLNHTFARDKAVATWCKQRRITFHEFSQNGIWRAMPKRSLWQTNFKFVLETPTLPIPKNLSSTRPARSLAIGRIPSLTTLGVSFNTDDWPEIGERAAAETLRSFLHVRGGAYSGGISSMLTAPTACSRLSVHFAWGTLSLRQAWQASQTRLKNLDSETAVAWRRSLPKFQSRLFWHAHFVQKLEDEVLLEYHPANKAFEGSLPVVIDDECARRLQAWITGTTGFPTVDAAMRYYRRYGWLNFRSRAMVTSFAVHALRIPWQTIQYELAKFMIDYVPGINTTQVQMQTGVTGINTIRVYSPMKQMVDHDAAAIFIKTYIPELSNFSPAEIAAFQTTTLGTYPKPIIDFKTETKIMKDALYSLKKTPIGRVAAKQVYQKHGSRKRQNIRKQSDS